MTVRATVGKATLWRHAPAHPFDGWVSEFVAADARAVVVVDAGECGWTRGVSAEASLAMEAFERGWNAAAGDPRERLRNAFAAVRRDFESREPMDNVAGAPWASLIAAMITGDRAVVRWIGAGEAMLVRDGAVVARTIGHTLCAELLRDGHLTEDERGGFDDVTMRVFSADLRDAADEVTEWPINTADCLVLVDGRSAHALTRATVLQTLDAAGSPAAAARTLIATSGGRPDFYRASAAVVALLPLT